jgi:transcriptional regulator with XRE-family HTH domain
MSAEQINAGDLRRRMQARARRLGGQAQLAKSLGVSTGLISEVLSGRREPNARIAQGMGFRRSPYYIATGRTRRDES